ncbi:hypothetical protein A7K94_0201155, partial [Modestobacter sp. VKM Ac-2676]
AARLPGPGGWVGVRRALDRRGGQLIVSARFVPGGRTAVTTASGALGYPPARFAAATAIAAVLWTAMCVLLGFLGSAAFAHDPLLGVLVGVGLALLITVVVEVARWVRRRPAEEETPVGRIVGHHGRSLAYSRGSTRHLPRVDAAAGGHLHRGDTNRSSEVSCPQIRIPQSSMGSPGARCQPTLTTLRPCSSAPSSAMAPASRPSSRSTTSPSPSRRAGSRL